MLHPYDFLMLAVLILSALFGAWKGMAWQLAALASLVLSAVVAVRFAELVAPLLGIEEPLSYFAAMLLLGVVTSLVVWIVFRLVAGIIDRVQLREFDRQLGALFGVAKGIIWCMVITFFMVTLSENARQTVLRTHSGYYIGRLTRQATPLLPDRVRGAVGKYLAELDEKLQVDEEQGNEPSPDQLDLEHLRQRGGELRQKLRDFGQQFREGSLPTEQGDAAQTSPWGRGGSLPKTPSGDAAEPEVAGRRSGRSAPAYR